MREGLLGLEDEVEVRRIALVQVVPDELIGALQVAGGLLESLALALGFVLLGLGVGPLLDYLFLLVLQDLLPDHPAVVLLLQRYRLLLLVDGRTRHALLHRFLLSAGPVVALGQLGEQLSELPPFGPVLDLVGGPSGQVLGDGLPLVAVLEVALLEDLVFVPGPAGAFECGVEVVPVPLPEVFALHAREYLGQLVPTQLAAVLRN